MLYSPKHVKSWAKCSLSLITYWGTFVEAIHSVAIMVKLQHSTINRASVKEKRAYGTIKSVSLLTRAVRRDACSPGREGLVLIQFVGRRNEREQREKSSLLKHCLYMLRICTQIIKSLYDFYSRWKCDLLSLMLSDFMGMLWGGSCWAFLRYCIVLYFFVCMLEGAQVPVYIGILYQW